jgi:tetratricopeptide (TPR) repeat protein
MDSLRPNYLVIVGLLSVVALFSVRYLLTNQTDPYRPMVDWTQHIEVPAPPETRPFEFDPELENELLANTARTVREMGPELARMLERKEFAQLREYLLNLAAQAVSAGNKEELGHVMSLLGQLSIEEHDLDSAEVYLLEALDVYQTLGNTVGAAQVYMQLGRAHLKSREIARTAGSSYDKLLVARWQLSQGQYAAAEHNFRQVVEASISANRYGTAASAYYSLTRMYTENDNTFEAEQSAMEGARLYAASGQLHRAYETVNVLRKAGVEDWRLYQIKQEVERGYEEFQASVNQIERARDYRQLYNHYRSQGDEDRAWKLRLLANKSLKNVSKRAMYHRQPDALALLYVSNNDKGQAQDYFEIAKKTFDSEGLEALSTQVARLSEQIH